MSDVANQTQSGQAPDDTVAPRQPKWPWRPVSLWLWPAAAIGLTGAAAALFGAIGALLVGGVALAALVFFAGIVTLERDRWLAISLTAALIAALTVFVGAAWLKGSPYKGGHLAATATATPTPRTSWTPPANWPWQRITQAMAQQANFRGADLNGADLAGLQLSHMNFDGALANGTSFRGSQLAYASLRGASLQGACLQGANLTGADLTGANLNGADVAGVTVSPGAKKAALVWPRGPAVPTAACQ